MRKKICKRVLLITLLLISLYSFNITTAAAEDEDFSENEVTFTLIQGKDSPGDKNGAGTNPLLNNGTLPRTGGKENHLFLLVGLLILVIPVWLIVAKRGKERISL